MIGPCAEPVQSISCLLRFVMTTNRYLNGLSHSWNTGYHILFSVPKSIDKMERDRLVLFINKLILHRRNVKDILDAGGVRILADLLTLAHLHTSRYAGFRVTGVAVRPYRIMFR